MLRHGPIGMQQPSQVDVEGFHIRGYAGADHGDQLQAMPYWLKKLDVR